MSWRSPQSVAGNESVTVAPAGAGSDRRGTVAARVAQVTPRLLTVWAAVLLLGQGCTDMIAFTDEDLVAVRTRKFALAVSADRWQDAIGFCHQRFVWRQLGGGKRSGRAAVGAFLQTIRDVGNRDGFYIKIKKTKKINETRILTSVIFQIHTIEDSAQMDYSNYFWRGEMLWEKEGVGDWQLRGIRDRTKRVKSARFPGE